jgi:hypothetical protein
MVLVNVGVEDVDSSKGSRGRVEYANVVGIVRHKVDEAVGA